MAVAVATSRTSQDQPAFNVIGVDLPTPGGKVAINSLNAGTFPFRTTDKSLAAAVERAREAGNLIATSDARAFSLASVIVVDVNLDFCGTVDHPDVDFTPLVNAVTTVGRHMRPHCLLVIETTVPPGTCERVVAPALAEAMKGRGFEENAFMLAHSYEQAMPGDSYLDSITNYWRVYAGHTPEAAEACEAFLSQVINVRDYPLTRLPSTTASETAKVLENSIAPPTSPSSRSGAVLPKPSASTFSRSSRPSGSAQPMPTSDSPDLASGDIA